MATNRVVVGRTRRVEKPESRDLPFTRDMTMALPRDGSAPDFVNEYRAQAWEVYERLPLPTTSEEAWRRTDLRTMRGKSFRSIYEIEPGSVDFPAVPAELLQPLVSDQHGGQLILTPTGSQLNLGPDLAAKGVVFTDLATAVIQYPEIVRKILGRIVKADEGKFAALAAAMSRTGVIVYVPRNVQISEPLHSILWGPGSGLAYFSHVLIYLEQDSSLTYVHEAASHTDTKEQTLHAGIVEIHVGAGANLRFVELQSWGEHVWNFSHERVQVERGGNLDWIFGAVGSHLTKTFSEINLIGEGATGRMSGFYFTDGLQHLDHDTQQNHLAPHTTSDLLFKGALRGHSRSVWQGMIYVAPGAQKTDGYQANRNLVLSPQARADSIPGLEILADDVRCTHGVTVGKIDREQLFYLSSRGIPYREAERLIVEGFFDPIMQRIPFEGVRMRFQEAIVDKMG